MPGDLPGIRHSSNPEIPLLFLLFLCLANSLKLCRLRKAEIITVVHQRIEHNMVYFKVIQ